MQTLNLLQPSVYSLNHLKSSEIYFSRQPTA